MAEERDAVHSEAEAPTQRYRVRPHETELRRDIDPVALNRLADELEDEVLVAGLRAKT